MRLLRRTLASPARDASTVGRFLRPGVAPPWSGWRGFLPLADLVGALLAGGLTLRQLREPGAEDDPLLLALSLER
jgi:hypothetical protein